MPKYLPVQGTHGWHGYLDPSTQWWHPASPFARFMGRNGYTQIGADDPFIWSTSLDGISPWMPTRKLLTWRAGGAALAHYLRPPLMKNPDEMVPYADRNLIAHSHALNVVLSACCEHHLKIRSLISVCSPVRFDLSFHDGKRMRDIAKEARPLIGYWLHISTDRSDWIQLLGSLFDGRRSGRKHPLADLNDSIPGIGHTGVLMDPRYFNLWKDLNWLAVLDGQSMPVPQE